LTLKERHAQELLGLSQKLNEDLHLERAKSLKVEADAWKLRTQV